LISAFFFACFIIFSDIKTLVVAVGVSFLSLQEKE